MTSYLRSLNNRQRQGVFVSIVVMLLVMVVHNPTQGYVTEVWASCEGLPTYLCSAEPRQLSFFAWRSQGSMSEALSTLGAVALAVIAVLAALAAWLFLFVSPRNDKSA